MTISPVGLNPVDQAQLTELQAAQAAARAVAPGPAGRTTGADEVLNDAAAQAQAIQDARNDRGIATAQVNDQILADQDLSAIQQAQTLQEAQQQQAIEEDQLQEKDLQNRLQADAIERAQVADQILQNGQAPDAAEQIRVGQNQQAQLAQSAQDTPLTPQQEMQVESITVIQATTINEGAVESGTGEAVDLTI
jgi:hypothetical protein